MEENKDVRWKQRLSNLNKALHHLGKALTIENPDFVQKAGIIQLFEMSFELGWKLLKDFLGDQGFQDVKSPGAALKKAFEIGLIAHGHQWMQLLEDRNLMAHTYDEGKATEMVLLIHGKYYPILKELQETFNQKTNEN
jgi:nucleotidyltransferase substrate binding protein (TIGR01987 family)